MPYVDPEFTVPTIPEDEKYEGTEIDDNLRKGTFMRQGIDQAVLTIVALPEDNKVVWAATHGASFWAITTKIDTERPDGTPQPYFVKVRDHEPKFPGSC
jgi:hypothetical protein